MAFANMLGMGGSAVLSMALGGKDETRAKNASSFVTYASLFIGVAFAAVLILFMDPILALFGANEQTVEFARGYTFHISYGAPFIIWSAAASFIVRAEGASKEAMVGSMIGTIANIVLDPIFKRVGLSGKSVIPMVIGTGCAIPGVMACRTIRNERERRTTAMLTPFMPCGAKLPVIALFAGAFFGDASWVGPVMYLVGILLILLGALLVKRITGQKFRKSFFIIELPEYKVPSLLRACVSMLERGKAYIIKAGTIILVCNTVVQIMQSFNWQFQLVEEGAESTSILASIASPFSVLFIPLGFGVWQLAAAAITGFIAKENVVGTLAVVYGVTNLIDVDELALIGNGADVATIMGLTKVAALAYLMFNLYTPPCFAALGAMNSEMKSGKWLFGGICLQLATGYTVAFLVYQIGTLATTGSLGTAFVPGLIAVLVFVAIVIWRIRKSDREFSAEYSLHTS